MIIVGLRDGDVAGQTAKWQAKGYTVTHVTVMPSGYRLPNSGVLWCT